MSGFLIPATETPEQQAARKRQAVASALASPQAQSVGEAVGQGMAGFGDAMAYRQQQPQNQFPVAPGGEDPSFMQAMRNLMGVKTGSPY